MVTLRDGIMITKEISFFTFFTTAESLTEIFITTNKIFVYWMDISMVLGLGKEKLFFDQPCIVSLNTGTKKNCKYSCVVVFLPVGFLWFRSFLVICCVFLVFTRTHVSREGFHGRGKFFKLFPFNGL